MRILGRTEPNAIVLVIAIAACGAPAATSRKADVETCLTALQTRVAHAQEPSSICTADHLRNNPKALAACVDALDDAGARRQKALESCGAVYQRIGCRRALATVMRQDASRKFEHVSKACAQAYCADLPPPKPKICAGYAAITLGDRGHAALELDFAILKNELGEKLAFDFLERMIRLGHPPLLAAFAAPGPVLPDASRPLDRAPLVRITGEVIEVEGETVVEHPDASADCELARLRAALESLSDSRPGPRIVLQVAVDVPGLLQSCALNAIKAAGYPEVEFAVDRATSPGGDAR